MEHWFRSHYDIYNYKAQPFRLPTIKSIFKSISTPEKDNIRNSLIEDKARCVSIKSARSKDVDVNGNTKTEPKEDHVWRRMSLQSYRKRKQQRREEKSKPVIAAVLRTYDRGGLFREPRETTEQRIPATEWL